MHRILGLDIGAQSIKATLIDARMRSYEILQSYVEPIPEPEQITPKIETAVGRKSEADKNPAPGEDFPSRDEDQPGEKEDLESAKAEIEVLPTWAIALKNLIERTGLVFEEAVCGMAGHWASTRIISLPFSSRSKINQVLAFEIEDLVPFDMADMVCADQILSMKKSGSTVLASMARKEDIARLLRFFNAAGVDPKVLTLNCSALSVAALNLPETGEGTYAVIDIGASSTDVVIVDNGQIALMRSITEGGRAVTSELARDLEVDFDDAEKLKTQVGKVFASDAASPEDERVARLSQSLVQAHQSLFGRLRQTIHAAIQEGQYRIEKIYLLGGGTQLPGFDNFITDALGISTKPFPMIDAKYLNFSGAPDRSDNEFVASLGLALSAAPTSKLKSVNFRIGEFAYRKIAEEVQGGLKVVAAMGGILLALLIVLLAQGHKVRSDRITGLEQQAQKIYLESFNQPAPPGSIVGSFRSKISEVSDKYKVIGYFGEGDVRALDVLRAMAKSIPAEIPIDVKQLDIKSEFAKFEAVTDNFQSVNKIESELAKHEIFKSVDREDAKKTAGDKIKFKLTMHMVSKTQGASGVATMMKKHGTTALPGSGNASSMPGAANGGTP